MMPKSVKRFSDDMSTWSRIQISGDAAPAAVRGLLGKFRQHRAASPEELPATGGVLGVSLWLAYSTGLVLGPGLPQTVTPAPFRDILLLIQPDSRALYRFAAPE